MMNAISLLYISTQPNATSDKPEQRVNKVSALDSRYECNVAKVPKWRSTKSGAALSDLSEPLEWHSDSQKCVFWHSQWEKPLSSRQASAYRTVLTSCAWNVVYSWPFWNANRARAVGVDVRRSASSLYASSRYSSCTLQQDKPSYK